MGFAPIAQVTDGMAVVDSLYANYGEGAPDGGGPDQGRIATEGNAYLQKSFPLLDFIRRARVVP
jgi:peptidyl-prolyl cis-trans isomerase A (cyclophilin A)